MFGHVIEFAVKTGFQPCAEAGFCCAQVDVRDADLLKAERQPQLLMCRASSGESGAKADTVLAGRAGESGGISIIIVMTDMAHSVWTPAQVRELDRLAIGTFRDSRL